jgi:hypothetical protein
MPCVNHTREVLVIKGRLTVSDLPVKDEDWVFENEHHLEPLLGYLHPRQLKILTYVSDWMFEAHL